MKDLHIILNDIVESIRPTSPIINISASGGNYIYEALNDLEPLNYVTLTDGTTTWENLKVIASTDSTFTLSENYAATSYIANAPYFMHEKEPKAFQVLTEKTKQDTFKYQKYPLVLLIRPFDKNNSDIADYECDFRIAIINSTEQSYWADDRYENNFDPILTPILESFIEGITKSNNIAIANPRKIDRTFVDDLFISGNPLPDELDAIIIDFKTIPIICDNCTTTIPSDTFDVNTSIVGDGSILSNPVTLTDLRKNTLVSLCANPNSGNIFDNWLIDGITYSNQLINLYVVKTVSAVATFIQSGLSLLMQVFDSIPVQRGLSWFFGDHSTNDNDVLIGNQATGTCSTASAYIETGIYQQGSVPVELILEFYINNINTVEKLFQSSTSASFSGMYMYKNKKDYYFYIGDNNGHYQSITVGSVNNGVNRLRITWSGIAGDIISCSVNNGFVTETVSLYDWVGDSTYPIRIGGATNNLTYAKLNNHFEYVFNHGYDDTIYDISGNGNDGTVVGANLEEFWGVIVDDAEPYEMTKGATLYQIPQINYLSENLVINGDFSDGLTGWSDYGGAVSSIEDNKLKIVLGGFGNTYQKIPCELGHRYVLIFKGQKDPTVSRARTYVGSDIASNYSMGIVDTYTDELEVTISNRLYFSPTSTNTYIKFNNDYVGTAYYDDIIVREVDFADVYGVEGSIFPICYDKTEEITGFDRLGYFPPNSGALKGLPNTYHISGVDAIIPEGDYTIEELIAFESENVVIEQNDYAVTLFKVLG